jgi:hypothetical protein
VTQFASYLPLRLLGVSNGLSHAISLISDPLTPRQLPDGPVAGLKLERGWFGVSRLYGCGVLGPEGSACSAWVLED